jgi:hypothetical protein
MPVSTTLGVEPVIEPKTYLIGFDLFPQGVLIDSASSVQLGLTEAARLGVGR